MDQRNAVMAIATTFLLSLSNHTLAQDMMGLDITSDAFTKSETTRAAIEEDIAKLRVVQGSQYGSHSDGVCVAQGS